MSQTRVNFVASWRPDADKFYNADAQKVAEEIYSIGENPQASDILNMARNSETETHKLIEWNDTVAAEKYRLKQVTNILHDLHIVKIGLNEEKKEERLKVPVRMFYHLNGESGYRSSPAIFQDESLHHKLLMTAMSELHAFSKKYATLSELKPVFEAIQNLDKTA